MNHRSVHSSNRTAQKTPTICGLDAGDAVTLGAEVRNLTDNQVADLWGYPLPGLAAFLSIDIDFSLSGD